MNFWEEASLWQRLCDIEKPLVLYGMGDGADKLLARLAEKGKQAAGVFASDEFVRGQSFRGYEVLTYAEAKRRFGDMCVLVCFGTEQPDVLARIYAIAEEQDVLAPHLPLFGDAIFDEDFWAVHKAEVSAAENIWADDRSRAVYRGYLAYMWSGRIDILREIESERVAAWQELSPGADEVFWDLGAYDGDTVAEFLRLVGDSYRAVVAVEPDEKNYKKLQQALQTVPRAAAYPYAVWQKSGEVQFAGKAGRNSAVAGEAAKKVQSVAAISLDDLHRQTKLDPSFIKFDVEGAEEAAILGGSRLLGEVKPKLAVSAYHRTEDIFRLPLLLKQLNPAYKLLLRHHPYVPGWETNIYAY